MLLNFRKPTFVILGSWNQAILERLDWLARYVFEYGEGAPVKGLEVLEQSPVTPFVGVARLIHYIEDIGFLVEAGRLSIFVNVDKNFEQIFNSLEERVIKIVETLHHTPMGGYGINFSIKIDNPSDLLVGSFDTPDEIKGISTVETEKHTLAVKFEELGEDVILNLSKTNLKDRVIVDFNYHHKNFQKDQFKENARGSVFKLYNKTLDILKNCYEVDIEHIDVEKHTPKEVRNGNKEENDRG